jgi:hypothetical protein
MKILLTLILTVWISSHAKAVNPSFQSFDTTIFSTNSYKISLKPTASIKVGSIAVSSSQSAFMLELGTAGTGSAADGVEFNANASNIGARLFRFSRSGVARFDFGYDAPTDQFFISDGVTILFSCGRDGSVTFTGPLTGNDALTLAGNAILNGSVQIGFGATISGGLVTDTAAVGTSLTVGGGAAITKILSTTATLDFPSTPAQTSSDLTVTVTGAAVGDVVGLGVPNASTAASGSYSGWVLSANTVKVRFENNSTGSLDPTSGTFRVIVTHF